MEITLTDTWRPRHYSGMTGDVPSHAKCLSAVPTVKLQFARNSCLFYCSPRFENWSSVCN